MAEPIRLISLPWRDPTRGDAETAVHARRYLAVFARGEHSDEVRDWLESFERGRENWVGALRVAERRPDPDDAELLCQAPDEGSSSDALSTRAVSWCQA